MTRTPTGKTKVNIYMDERTLEALRRIGEARGITHSELIREACRRFVHDEIGKVVQEATEYKRLVPR